MADELPVFCSRLKKLRENEHLTQVQLAQILNISKQSIWNYEANHREPNLETINRIADHFGVSTDYLLGRTEHKSVEVEKISNLYGINPETAFVINELKKLPQFQFLLVNIYNHTVASEDQALEAAKSSPSSAEKRLALYLMNSDKEISIDEALTFAFQIPIKNTLEIMRRNYQRKIYNKKDPD